MKRVVGFALLCLAVGIIFTILVRHPFIELICAIVCALVGYELLCGKE